MSFNDNYQKLRKERLIFDGGSGTSFEKEYSKLRAERLEEEEEEDIAPVRELTHDDAKKAVEKIMGKEEKEEADDDRKWFQKGAFEDGYQFGDITKTIFGSDSDLANNVTAGILGIGEKVVDTGATVVGGVAGLFGNDKVKDKMSDFIEKDLYDEHEKAKQMNSMRPTAIVRKLLGVDAEEDSVFGEKTDDLAYSGGQLVGTVGLQSVGVPWYVTTGATSFGGAMEGALREGATFEEAAASSAISAGAEILSEKLFGGSGLGETGLINLDGLTKGISNKLVKALADYGVDVAAEGFEEIFSQFAGNFASSLYKEDDLEDLLFSEEAIDGYIESFIGGGVLGGGMNVGNVTSSIQSGKDYRSGLTANEEAVVNKVYEDRIAEVEENGETLTAKEKDKIYEEVVDDLNMGFISIEDIEGALGGDTYMEYKNTMDEESELQREFDELGNLKKSEFTAKQDDRYNELKQKLAEIKESGKSAQLKAKLGEDVFGLAQGSLLENSYNERANRGRAFEADLNQYDAKQQEIVKKAIDSGILNNSNRTHQFVDIVAKISADKGVSFDFVNNAKLKESGFALDGKVVNGFVTKDGISINIDSPKAWQSTVGHEITHVLEGTELYTELQSSLFEYAETKGDLKGRRDALAALYDGVEGADVDAELTADLVGDYLFTDSDFINNLSTQHRNVFQKVYDEIKYLCRVATAGSKEARQLEKVRHAFENAYRESGGESSDTKYSLSMVDAVQPSNGGWQRGATTDEVRAAHPTLYAVDEEATTERNPTQVKGTIGSYRKVYQALENEGFHGAILDASSGLGYGTKAGIEEFGFDVDDVEPYPDSDYKPKYTDYSKLDKKYDAIISNAVLNVIPQDQRDALVVKMGELLNPGGRIFINVRGKDVLNASGKIAINEANMEYFIPRTAKTGSYQKGFTKPELVSYLQDALGEGFTVEPTNMFGAVSAVVTKDGAKYSLSDQIKSVANERPTGDPDIRFSLSGAVEETKDLMALHNLHTDEVLKQLEMGGIPYPSVAVTKPDLISHEGFGEVTLILPKETIDPKTSKYNKIYSADAYTPTFPKISYEASMDVADRISNKVIELYERVPEYYRRSLASLRDYTNINERLNSNRGERGMITDYSYDYGLKQLYLADIGEAVPVVTSRTEKQMTDTQKEQYQSIVDRLGTDAVNSLADKGWHRTVADARRAWLEEHGEALKDAYAEYWSGDGLVTKAEALEIANGESDLYWFRELRQLLEYAQTGGTTIEVKEDYNATDVKIDEKIDESAYKKWLGELFGGIEGRSGLRNDKDMFTPSGNRRSFSQLHDPITIDNVIKAMRKKEQKGEGAFGTSNINGASARQYGSISEVKADSSRLGKMEQAEHDAIQREITDRLYDIAIRYANGKDTIDAKDTLVEAVAKYESKEDIARYLKQFDYVYKHTDDIVNDLIELRDYIRTLSTPYFEAKPRRAVGFDEVGVFVIPRNADVKLKQELLNRGYAIAEYDPDVVGDRQKVVNSFEEYKFSLSDANETPKRYGSFATPARDLRYEAPVQENVAPVQDGVQGVQDVQDVQDTVQNVNDTVQDDDFAPIPEDVANGIQDENMASLTDADAPPEMEAPFYGEGEAVTVDDPFEDRDIKDVGNRKVKAYMFENPEVKPFFQAEANVMLGELRNSTKGERFPIIDQYDGYIQGYSGVQRNTSQDIAYLLDECGYTYDEIEKGLRAIIEDNGAENNACSKRIEFLLNDRLLKGNVDFETGMELPPNQEYIDLLNEKQITEYNEESFKRFMETADMFAPPASEDIGPVVKAAPVNKTSEAIAPPPSYQTTRGGKDGVAEGQRTFWSDEKTAEVYDVEPETAKKKNRALSKFRTNFVDKGSVFEDLSLKTKNRELMGKYNYMLYSEGRAQHLMGEGTSGVKALNDIREVVESSGKAKQFYEYMYHMHNIDRMSLNDKAMAEAAEILKSLPDFSAESLEAIAKKKITDKTPEADAELIQKAREYVRLMESKNKPVFGDSVTAEVSRDAAARLVKENPEFKAYAEDVYTYLNHLRSTMVESGVISQETADLWAEMYPHYVPVRRLGDEGLNVDVPLFTGRTGVNAPVKRATGGNRDILPLFDTIALRTEQTFKANAKNRFGVELMNTLGTTIERTETNIDEAIDSVDQQDGLLQEGKDGRNPTFTVFENGERVTFEITEDMYDALKPTSDGLLYRNKLARGISNAHRGLLTEYNPVFMFNNAIKDAQDILINSQHPVRTYMRLPKAIKELATKGRWYTEYMENGGEQNTYFDGQTKTFKAQDNAFKRAIGMPLRAMSAANNFVERMPRLAEYIASREAGQSIEVAMLDSARVTTNFAAGGDVTKFLNGNGATFLNASVQGAAQQIRNVREAKSKGLEGWVSLAARTIAAGLPALLLNGLLWDDDEDYEELSDYVKQNYYVVAKYGDGQFVRIPKGRTLAVIQDAFEQMGNLVTGNDEVDMRSFVELAISNLAPNNPIENNILAPIIQAANNETWYGDDLVPTRLQDLPSDEQFDESTDSISRWLGESLGVSPYKVNYLLDQYSGGVGDVFLPMLTPGAERGDDSLVGNMIAPLKDKFSTDSVMKNQNVSDFYDTVDELTTNAKSSKATDEDILMYKYMNTVNAELGELYAEKREIQNSDLANDEKYAAVRDVQDRINAIARESLETYWDVHIDNGYASIGDRHFRLTDDGEWQKITDDQLERQEEVTSGLGISPSEYWNDKAEYDFAYDYPEKYAFFQDNGITYDDYDAADEDGKRAYSWAAENPEKYTLSKAVTDDLFEYRKYASELYDIRADKDEDGKAISGSAKEKKRDYIFGLDLDYGQKIILYRSLYDSKEDRNTYNADIVQYLDSRDDISYEEMKTILEELGMKMDANGWVTWD